MKDLKLVLLFALPVIAVVAGFLVVNAKVEEPEPHRTYDPSPTIGGSGYGTDDPEVEDPEPPMGGVTSGLRPPTMKDPKTGEMDWDLTPDRLRDLLAGGKNADWVAIDQLINQGVIHDEEAISKLLIAELEENAMVSGSWVAKLLPMLAAKRPGIRDQLVDDLLNAARGTEQPNGVSAATMVVGQIGTSRAVQSLAEIARSQTDPNAAGAAIVAIGAIGSREPDAAAAELTRLLREKEGKDFHRHVFEAMKQVRHPAMVEALVPLLSSESPTALRRAAILGLGATGEASAVPVLTGLTRGENDRDTKQLALHSLGALGSKEAVEQLMVRMKESDELSVTAALSVGEAKGRGVSKVILDNFDQAPSNAVKRRWMHALQQNREESAVPGVRSIFKSAGESPQIRAEAAVTLSKLGDADSVGAIAAELEKATGMYARQRYVEALRGFIPNPRAKDALKKDAVPVLRRLTQGGVKDPASKAALRVLRMLGE